MMRIDIAGIALVALAMIGFVRSQPQRADSARSYAEAVGYNRSITGFLVEHRERIAGRSVAVLGVSGLSPWSQTNGAYLTRLLGTPVAWRVYVPAVDIFYTLGTLPEGVVTVRPEAAACDDDPRSVFVVFDERGAGTFANDCRDALARAHPAPIVARWSPARATPAMAASGFVVSIMGERLGSAVTVHIDGKEVDVVRGDRGRLMTALTPPLASPSRTIALDVRHRGDSVARGEIEVAAQR